MLLYAAIFKFTNESRVQFKEVFESENEERIRIIDLNTNLTDAVIPRQVSSLRPRLTQKRSLGSACLTDRRANTSTGIFFRPKKCRRSSIQAKSRSVINNVINEKEK